MSDKCKQCELWRSYRQCDFVSPLCRLLDGEILTERPDLIGNGQHRNRMKWAEINAPIFAATRERQQATAALGFRKYDTRLKHSRGFYGNRKAIMAAVKEARVHNQRVIGG